MKSQPLPLRQSLDEENRTLNAIENNCFTQSTYFTQLAKSTNPM